MPKSIDPRTELTALLSATGIERRALAERTGIAKVRIDAFLDRFRDLPIDELARCKAVLTDALRIQTGAAA